MTKIRERRIAMGWTQADLAKKINTQASNASRLEIGTAKAGPGMMARVSAALAVNAGDLFDPNGWPLIAGVPAAVSARVSD